MRDPIDALEQLGFGEYEARAYIALLQQEVVTGYELAKVSGIPRANIYSVLQKLEERGAIVRIASLDATHYAPVPVEEVLDRIERRHQNAVRSARDELRQLSRPVQHDYVWNVQNYPMVLEQARTLLTHAQTDLLIALYPEEARELSDTIAKAEARGVTLTMLCMADCAEPCGGCRGHLVRYRAREPEEARWLLVVPDGLEVLAGEVGSENAALAVRSRQPLLVKLTNWFIRHSIALATMDDNGREQ